MRILAIESSCDETAAAIVEDGTLIRSNNIATSTTMHAKWGGVVPEVAAREQLKSMIPVLTETLSPFQSQQKTDYRQLIIDHIDALAVTVGPGLIGSLLMGVEAAKTIAFATGKPLIPVNHVLAHMYANFIETDLSVASYQLSGKKHTTNNQQPTTNNRQPITYPAISLVVSGGHTELFLMQSPKKLTWLGGTIDDAAGEAFDKTARLLGFGNRGGVAIQEAASQHIPTTNNQQLTTKLPRPLLYEDSLNFSFSGLKTAVMREWKKVSENQHLSTNNSQLIASFAYEIQEAITDVLVAKTMKAVSMHNAQSILLSGGVAANLRLREKFHQTLNSSRLALYYPPISLCTDNAVYIASYAYFRGEPVDWHAVEAQPDLSVEI